MIEGQTQFEGYGDRETQIAVDDEAINYPSLEEPPPYEDVYEGEPPIEWQEDTHMQPNFDRESHLINPSSHSKSSPLVNEEVQQNETPLPADIEAAPSKMG
jgi:hypothetical protein